LPYTTLSRSRVLAGAPVRGRRRDARRCAAGRSAPMIRMLLHLLGEGHDRPLRRTVALMTAAAVAEGLSYALLVPVLRALFGPRPAEAWPWLAAFAAAVAVYAVLRYGGDLAGFRGAAVLLRGVYRRFRAHPARLPVGPFTGPRGGEVAAPGRRGVPPP